MITHQPSPRPSLLARFALVLGLAVVVGPVTTARAQPAPAGPGSTAAAPVPAAVGSAAAPAAVGSAATPAAVGSAAAPAAVGTAAAPAAVGSAAAPAAVGSPAIPSTTEMRQMCAQALNADHTFAMSIIGTLIAQLEARPAMFRDSDEAQRLLKVVSESTLDQHQQAATAIAKNERHVIMAYAAMWMLAALFVLFLWSRQRQLKIEIAQLRRDLEVAAK